MATNVLNQLIKIETVLNDIRRKEYTKEEGCEPTKHDFVYQKGRQPGFFRDGVSAHIWCKRCGKVKVI